MKKRPLSFNRVSYVSNLSKFLFIVLLFKVNLVNGQLISNVSTSTGHPYSISTLNNGAVIYTDRDYIATDVPPYIRNAPFIKTPNDDKKSTSPISFKLSQSAIVYIGYDPRATALPAWLQSWQKLPEVIDITDPKIPHFDIFAKSYPAGSVTIGGNVASPAANVLNMSIIVAVATNVSNTPPTVSITSPANNSSFNATTVNISAAASDGDGLVSKVDFYADGTTFLGTDNTSPYSFTWNGVPAGTHTLTARATDNGGLSTTSSGIFISVTTPVQSPPAVSLTSPLDNTVYTTVPATIKLTATATAFNTTINKVEFYKGTTLINTQRTAPYAYSLSKVALGNYTFSAKATDNKGLSTMSASIAVGVHNKPSVVSVNPANKATNVDRDASISTNVLKLPNGGIDNSTITSAAVFLTDPNGNIVPSNVNGTGGGDAVTLVPASTLKINTVYKFNITSALKDLSGTPFTPFTSTFTTNSVTNGLVTIQFEKVALPNTTGRHTCVTIGPDRKLYALADDGLIKRYVINGDGTLSGPELLYSLQDSYGTRRKTLAIGLTFDPSSTANNLIAWVSHCNTYVFTNAPDWDDKLTRLTGNNLQNVQDVLINLPRSAKDHVTNSIAFGPDGALYYTQGSTSAMGRADQTWNLRDEHLLSCAVLRLDLNKLTSVPLDVKTSEGGGSYNPYAANAPLTIYASGIRNSYDLLWHSNGNLYVATNGSAAGGNTPASVKGTRRPDGSTYNGPTIPALSNIQQTMEDFLYRIVKGGYYGHPNPQRGEYVLNGGNPTSHKDSAEVPSYPVGTLPDANWRGNVYNFKNNISPNGFIEYKGNSFNGALKGRLLFVRYSAHDDIITLTPGPNNNIIAAVEGVAIPGFSGFIDPLDITEDVATGDIYVSEYGGDSGKITLLRPTSVSKKRSASGNNNNAVASTSAFPINTISGCDDGISVVIAADKVMPLLNIQTPKISPNPIQKKFNIQFPTNYEGEYTLQIVDISGRVYQIGKINLKGGTNMGVDVSKLFLKAGTYFLKLTSENKKAEVFKLIINGN